MILGGPVLYLLGESLFDWRVTGAAIAKPLAVAALIILLVPLGVHISVLLLSLIVASLLPALAVWELRALEWKRPRVRLAHRCGRSPRRPRASQNDRLPALGGGDRTTRSEPRTAERPP
jgi:hypothetical protein